MLPKLGNHLIFTENLMNIKCWRSLIGQDAETDLWQISNGRRDKFHFTFVSNYLMEGTESDCIEYKALKAGEHFDAKNSVFNAKFAEIE